MFCSADLDGELSEDFRLRSQRLIEDSMSPPAFEKADWSLAGKVGSGTTIKIRCRTTVPHRAFDHAFDLGKKGSPFTTIERLVNDPGKQLKS